jgi:hypothetical protein
MQSFSDSAMPVNGSLQFESPTFTINELGIEFRLDKPGC